MSASSQIVLIHGLVGNLNYFDPQRHLPGMRVLAVDLLGYGAHRDAEPGRLSLAAQADHVLAAMDKAGVETVWLCGHSMGGAVMIVLADRLADRGPERVAGLINVEGNFTEQDTFWSRRIIAYAPNEWRAKWREMHSDPAGWLQRCDVLPTPERITRAEQILANQPPETVQAMSRVLVEETADPAYDAAVRRAVARFPLHLLAGERSAQAWGVPKYVRKASASDRIQPATGHMMMLEDPAGFCRHLADIMASAPHAPDVVER